MCKLASFIVTRERVLWHPGSDSHENIIDKYKLDDRKQCDFVRVELSPPNEDYTKPLTEWVYRVDQDNTPEWYSAKEAEIAARHELDKWRKKRQWFFDAIDFVQTIKDVKWLDGHKKPLKAWKVFAARSAAWDAVRSAVRDGVRSAARSAAWDAVRSAVRDGVRSAAGLAAGSAVRDAVRSAAGSAAQDAERDADLMARCIVVADKIDPKHLAHAKSRWAVWQAGYGLLCDVDGVLYVYRKP
jgi:hypothetical protein